MGKEGGEGRGTGKGRGARGRKGEGGRGGRGRQAGVGVVSAVTVAVTTERETERKRECTQVRNKVRQIMYTSCLFVLLPACLPGSPPSSSSVPSSPSSQFFLFPCSSRPHSRPCLTLLLALSRPRQPALHRVTRRRQRWPHSPSFRFSWLCMIRCRGGGVTEYSTVCTYFNSLTAAVQ